MEYKMICTDVDGTLLNEEHIVTEQTGRALHKAIERGLVLTITSARSPAGIEPIVKRNGFQCCVIAFNGALILDENRSVLYENGISVAEAKQILKVLEQTKIDLTWNLYTKDHWIVKSRFDPRVQREEHIVETLAEEGNADDLAEDCVVDKILCMVSPENMDKLETRMRELSGKYTIVRSSDSLLEIMRADSNKAHGMKWLCGYKGIRTEQVIAFGDNYNDVEMLCEAGYGVLMQNAPRRLKDAWEETDNENKRILTEDNNHDGIACVLEKVIDEAKNCDYNWCIK